jgi:hypothetical protein
MIQLVDGDFIGIKASIIHIIIFCRDSAYVLIWWMIALGVAACDQATQHRAGSVTQLNAWFRTGQEGERETIQDQATRFNQLDLAREWIVQSARS